MVRRNRANHRLTLLDSYLLPESLAVSDQRHRVSVCNRPLHNYAPLFALQPLRSKPPAMA